MTMCTSDDFPTHYKCCVGLDILWYNHTVHQMEGDGLAVPELFYPLVLRVVPIPSASSILTMLAGH